LAFCWTQVQFHGASLGLFARYFRKALRDEYNYFRNVAFWPNAYKIKRLKVAAGFYLVAVGKHGTKVAQNACANRPILALGSR